MGATLSKLGAHFSFANLAFEVVIAYRAILSAARLAASADVRSFECSVYFSQYAVEMTLGTDGILL